jgi:1-acyl-sn-glycerol-3-phosphate acyltransferase
MNRVEAAWWLGRTTLGALLRAATRLRVYGLDRVPREGGLVLALNHFSWMDPPAFGTRLPRAVYYVTKIEAHRIRGLGEFMRAFGAFAIRRGESDREAVRLMREIVRRGDALGVFVEGTRQEREPGRAHPGAAMVAIQERMPVSCGVVHGTEGGWTPRRPVTIAWSLPLRLDDLPRNARGYREGSARIEAEIRRQWEWLVELHALDRRPPHAVPPA